MRHLPMPLSSTGSKPVRFSARSGRPDLSFSSHQQFSLFSFLPFPLRARPRQDIIVSLPEPSDGQLGKLNGTGTPSAISQRENSCSRRFSYGYGVAQPGLLGQLLEAIMKTSNQHHILVTAVVVAWTKQRGCTDSVCATAPSAPAMDTSRTFVVSGVCNAAHLHTLVLVGDHPGCADMLQSFGCREPWVSGEIPVLCGLQSCHIVGYDSKSLFRQCDRPNSRSVHG